MELTVFRMNGCWNLWTSTGQLDSFDNLEEAMSVAYSSTTDDATSDRRGEAEQDR